MADSKLTRDERVSFICLGREMGLTYARLAKALGISRQRVHQLCKRHNTITYEHKGYKLQQTSYNWHCIIYDLATGEFIAECPYDKKLDVDSAKEFIEDFIELRKTIER